MIALNDQYTSMISWIMSTRHRRQDQPITTDEVDPKRSEGQAGCFYPNCCFDSRISQSCQIPTIGPTIGRGNQITDNALECFCLVPSSVTCLLVVFALSAPCRPQVHTLVLNMIIQSFPLGVDSSMLFLFLFLVLDNAYGFASNLVTTPIGCMTDLDTSEVIMNNMVRSAEDSDFPKMHLAVLIDDNHMESPYHYSSEDLTIVFVNPYTHDEFPDDLQFVIQLEGEGAEFVGGGSIGCEDNHRVSARLRDDGGLVALQIHDTSASFKMWAGWATGQNAVRLTPPLLLEPHLGQIPNIQDESEEIKESAAVKNEEVPASNSGGHGGGSREAGKEAPEAAATEKERHMVHTKETRKKKKPQPTDKVPQKGIEENTSDEIEESRRSPVAAPARQPNSGAAPPINKPAPEWKRMYDQEEHRKALEAEMERNFPDQNSFRYRYDHGIEVHMSAHLFACIFFLIAMWTFYAVFGSPREKGRRDL